MAVDFRKKETSKFAARLGITHKGNVSMEIRLDSLGGQLVGTANVPFIGANNRWALVTTDLYKVKDVLNIYFMFKGKA
jgi:arabinoxylan arabinofuranohydrolase